MRGSMIRHKAKVRRVIHKTLYKPGSTMVRFPEMAITKRTELGRSNRKKVASALKAARKK